MHGYASQIWRSVLIWLGLQNTERMYLEGAEDIDVIHGAAAETMQVKATAGNVTLRSRDVIEAINNAWLHQDRNPERQIRYRLLTTANIAMEHTLRTQADALRLRSALTVGSSLLVIGGGWIGLEVAATVRGMGCAVTVLEAAPRLCARTMPETVSDFLLRLHQSHGVIVRTGIGVTGLSEQESGVIATVDTGELLRADHVLIAIGIVPDTTLAVNCGLPVANGIVVDAQGRTADPDIFAAGDVACGHSDFAGAALRLESWANAQNQAIVAAKAALGRADRYDEIPWFWSDQYNINLQMLGLPDRGSKIVTRGAPEAGNGCWLMLRENGTAAGAVAVNAPRELRTLRKLFADERLPVLSAWADTAVPLQRLADRAVVACGGLA